MKPLLKLLRPYFFVFTIALVSLTFASLSNAALTGLITPLMDDVLTQQASEGESRTEQLFGFRDKIQRITDLLNDWGLGGIQEAGQLDLLNPLPWAILVFIVFSIQALFDFTGAYLMGRVGLKVIVDLRQRLIEKVMSLSLRFFKDYSTGEILTRINTDVLRIQQAVSVKMGELVKEGANTVAFLIFAFVLNWKLSLTLFVLVPLVGVPIAVMTRKIRKYASRSQSQLGHLTAHFKEVLVGFRIVKGFQKEAFEAQRLSINNRAFLKYALRELRVIALTSPLMSMIGMVVILAFVTYGASLIQAGEMSRGEFLTYLLVVYQLYQPIKRIARANSEIQQAVGVIPRLEEILEQENEIIDTTQPQRFQNYPNVEDIRFENLHFHYGDPNQPVLRGVDLRIQKGAVVALVGSSGSGKSTLVNLLPRFYDATEGRVAINGLDVRDMAKTDLRELIGVVTQDTILFDDTVHNNIAYGIPDTPREQVVAAAKKAFAHDFISKLPEGYDTMIGEAGGKLSGGQRQRISIARAVLNDAPILVLDEATSALDTESEREVQLALENLMVEKTTVVIAHRLSTIRKASEIVVMAEGRIVERGDHDALMDAGGLYKKLVQMQSTEGVLET